MRIIIIILFFSLKAVAGTYYISNAGSDGANGTSTGTPWQTIAKINGFTFASGDSVLFKCGDTWNERLKPPASNLYFGSYSTGNKPLITGLQTATMIPVGGNVYSSTITPVSNLNTVLINGSLGIKARFPNSTFLTYTASTTTSLTTSLTGTPDYTGKEIVVKSAVWVLDVTNVASQVAGTLTLSPATNYDGDAQGVNGYFFQNHVDFLDSASEWSYSAGSLKVYSAITPTVQYSNIDTTCWIRQKTNITFNGIAFTGANKAAILLDTCSFITILNCNIANSGFNGITGHKSHHTTISNDSIQNCLNGAVFMRRDDPFTPQQDTCNNTTVSNCYVKNIALYAGMGGSGDEKYVGVYAVGFDGIFSLNRMDSAGYIGMRFNGRRFQVKNNYISNVGFVKDDGGHIYTFLGSGLWDGYYDTGSIVRSNICVNGFGVTAGVISGTAAGTAGVYMDNATRGVTIDSNTVYNTTTRGIFLNQTHYITVRYNLIDDSLAVPLYAQGSSAQTSNAVYLKNIYYGRSSSRNAFYYQNYTAGFFINSSDSNYYLRPLAPTNLIHFGSTDYSYPHLFTDNTGFDLNGGTMPVAIRHNTGRTIYNPNLTDSTTILNDTYIDVFGNIYLTNWPVTLRPFTSKLLFTYTNSLTKLEGLSIF